VQPFPENGETKKKIQLSHNPKTLFIRILLALFVAVDLLATVLPRKAKQKKFPTTRNIIVYVQVKLAKTLINQSNCPSALYFEGIPRLLLH